MSKKKSVSAIDSIAAALNRARAELEQLGASSRSFLEAERALHAKVVDLGAGIGPIEPWWVTFSDYELGLKRLQRSSHGCENGYEHVAFLLIATDDLHEEWSDSRPCGTERGEGLKKRLEERSEGFDPLPF